LGGRDLRARAAHAKDAKSAKKVKSFFGEEL
jgi:hypothetical protein